MARSYKYDTVLNSGVPYSGASVSVKTVDAAGVQGGDATIYSSEAGAAKSNPFTTDAQGFWELWADTNARYNIIITGAGLTTRTIRWDVDYHVARQRTIDVTQLATDVVPIGMVVPWWRPANTVPVPTGWAICDGSTLLAAAHSFPSGGSIVLPDLRNKFILGANISNADAAAGSSGNSAANAPGIRGEGGANNKSFSHSHAVDSHQHGLASGGAFSGPGGSMNVVTAGNTQSASPGTDTKLSSSFDIRPQYAGLLMIMKVKNT